MKHTKVINIVLVLLIALPIFGQKHIKDQLKTHKNPEELVTLSENIAFDKAIMVLSRVSENLTGRKIISNVGLTDPIGLKINNMPYLKALNVIVKYKGLQYKETPNAIIIQQANAGGKSKELPEEEYASVDSREVKISAVFLEVNITELRERGLNWDWSISTDGLKVGTELLTFGENLQSDQDDGQTQQGGQQIQRTPEFKVDAETEFDMGEFSGEATAALKFFENENLGEIIAHPSITVRDRAEGRIQIGTDISIKQQDFAGNTVEQFISTGTIVNVTPYIYKEDGVDYILLDLNVERSSGIPGQITTEIRKTKAETDVLMLDGEETMIGGLYVTEETSERRGVPVLKDLPWWFLGLKYIFGYESTQLSKKEVIILIKTELVPSLKERIANKKEQIKTKLLHEKTEERVKSYSIKNSDDEE